jgi:hypothetical protein
MRQPNQRVQGSTVRLVAVSGTSFAAYLLFMGSRPVSVVANDAAPIKE